MKKNLFFSLITLLFVLFGTSCITDSWDNTPAPSNNTLQVSLNVQGIETRAAALRNSIPAEEGEVTVSNMYLLFFEPSTQGTGMFVDYVNIQGEWTLQANLLLDLSTTSLVATKAYNILIVANVDDNFYLEGYDSGYAGLWAGQWAGNTENQVITAATASAHTGDAINANDLLMYGRAVKTAGSSNINVSLSRNVVRFDVYNNRKNEYDLVSVSIWNAYPTTSIWGGGIMDYSEATSRIRYYYTYFNNSNDVQGPDGGNGTGDDDPILPDIKGGLYVFENSVIRPGKNDRFTTCLIIGLRDRATGKLTYYRANVSEGDQQQLLKRNNVYSLTIRNVTAEGEANEELAYTGMGAGLEYSIGFWNIDDNGLVVQDENSFMAIPTKTIRIGRAGGEFDFSITTRNNTGANPRLGISSQTYVPAGNNIISSLNGNLLHVVATPLAPLETERRGVITLTYAGLETSINIIQSGVAETYLQAALPDGGIPTLPYYQGIFTGLIRVEASGPWTARLFLDGFSFTQPGLSATPTTTIKSTDGLVQDGRFRLFTYSANEGETIREAFVVITLDEFPEDYISMVRVVQAPKPGIEISPTVNYQTFGGINTMNNPSTYNVRPSTDESGNIPEWEPVFVQIGTNNDGDKFDITCNRDAGMMGNNTVTIVPAGDNMSGRIYEVTLRLRLVGNPDIYNDITLKQLPANIELNPGTISTVMSVRGAQTGLIAVQADASLHWAVTNIEMTSGTSGAPAGGRTLVQHNARLVDASGNEIPLNRINPMSTQFRIEMPKVYYPNRQIPNIAAKVTISLIESGGMVTTDITVNQQMLTPNSSIRRIINSGQDWGATTYVGVWNTAIAAAGFTNIGTTGTMTSAIDNSVTLLQSVNQGTTSGQWTTTGNFIANRDAFTVMQVQSSAGRDRLTEATSPLRLAGYTGTVNYGSYDNVAAGANGELYSGHSHTKVYQFIMDRGNMPLTAVGGFYNDAINTSIAPPWGDGAVVITTKGTGNGAQLIIDVKNRFMYLGESEYFNTTTNMNTARTTFLDNLMYLIGNAAKYGSHFTDLLLEDDVTIDPPNTFNSKPQPAPWRTDYWGANAGVPSK
jgi:hypothetical protein